MSRGKTVSASVLVPLLALSLAAQSPAPEVKGPPELFPKGLGAADVPADAQPLPVSVKEARGGAAGKGFAITEVCFSQEGDALAAHGSDYKAYFDGRGMVFVPALGAAAPANTPVGFRLAGLSVDGRRRDLASATPERNGARVSYARPGVVEVYEATLDAVEQKFELAAPLGKGDYVFHVALETGLARASDPTALVFHGPFGKVRYTNALAIDANGMQLPLATTLEDDEIRIVLPETFLASAAWPVVVDPYISAVDVSLSSSDLFQSDVAFEGATAHWLVVAERVYSATDHDIWSWFLDAGRQPIALSLTVVDGSGTNYAHPRVASKRVGTAFLVVAEKGAAPGREIWGRIVQAEFPTSLGVWFEISGNELGDKLNPVVGGDPSSVPATYWMVTWERTYSATDSDVHCRRVSDQATPVGATILLSNSSAKDQLPAISKSNGAGPAATQFWTVVFQRDVGGEHDLLAAQLSWDAGTVTPIYPISTASTDTITPSVTGFTDPQLGTQKYLVAYEVEAGATDRIGFLIYEGTTSLGGTNDLRVFEGQPAKDRMNPVATCTGATFTIAYAEQFGSSADYDLYASTVNVVGGSSFSLSEAYQNLFYTADREDRPAIASTFDGRIRGIDCLVTCESGSTQRAIRAALYDASAPVGGWLALPTGCQGLGIGYTGRPIIGQPVSVSLLGAGALPVLAIGLPIPPVPVCGTCLLGVDLVNNPIILYAPGFAVTLPAEGALVGLTFAIQGADANGAACNIRTSDTLLVTIQ